MTARLRTAGLVLVLVALASAAGWWAGRTALQPPVLPEATAEPLWYEAANGAVGRTVQVPVLGSWHAGGVVAAPHGGTLTQRLVDSGTPVEAGTVVATIDLQPMVLASGDVPAFRDLRVGATGADVEQLQAFLAEQGWLDASGIDGRYQAATRNAVRSWQEHLTISPTGEVPLGHLLFVPELPVRLRWTADVGDVVQPGQPLADLLEAFPRFVAEIDRRTFSDVPAGGAVTVTGPSASTWPAHLGTVLDLGPDLATVAVVADQPGCGSPCEDVGLEGVTRFSGQVVLEEERSGPVVPAAAVTVNASGQHVVHVQGRGQVTVEVLAEADGQVVVSGIEVGDRVELPPERR